MSLASDRTIRGLVEIMSVHDDDHSEHFWRKLAGRIHAFAPRVTSLLADEPEEARDRVQLRQDWTSDLEDIVWWQEHVQHLKREYEDAAATLERVTAAAHRDRFDPEARDIDREDDRRAAALHDERAADAAPRGIGKAS